MDQDALTRMMRMIAPIEMTIADVQGTWKLSQNKPDAARLGAAAGVDAGGLSPLAALMRDPPV